ncbi:OB-fold domain-containing protein [Gordonia sp. zg691]|uniref:OB-fold domain-containing protein n=1 Tax=Gordonia jinghuaiqii TaxID=2758710 RepID=A0A7D7R1U4_9ACTN|nr:OB-fold domain-containing protein [Gordonia jinghuaiqii]MBD0863566.1 OB-fold domain-containing protein [Gordonia jinghuaiqii]MCR5979302.1 hypothetical protein [Gordonia jinghuaiqii]QMT01087.1 OB-fold domain-containing protein [Gordonia jinghuaiqii]
MSDTTSVTSPPDPTTGPATGNAVPIVDYLVLGDTPHLIAHECTSCAARYFDHRNACASCFGTDFIDVDVPTTGTLRTFTIVSFAAPGVPVPFVAGVVDCGGTFVRGNVINTDPTPENVTLGMPLRLATHVVGVDDNGTEAIGFGFEPTHNENTGESV